ncbi:MAG TPA: TRAP transporter large permease subunit [Syntrophorhabdus sp.]|nr:TRAP transporter large permease subunit [Syntrophorhabdus sp.]
MEWLFPFVVVFGLFLVFLSIGTPVFLAFTIVDIIGIYFFWGGLEGLDNFFHSVFASIANFTLLPVPFFILMGEILARSGVFINALDTLEKFLGRIPGRLCILTILGACIFSALSGSAMGTTAMFGALMIPEMEKRGYRMDIAIGSCTSGGLAVIIPPSALAVVIATLGDVSVGKMLISGIIPGVIMACLYIAYIIVRCIVQPEIAPPYEPSKVSWFVKISALFKNVMPFFIIVVAVTGVVFFGIATPTEAAAWGVLTSIGVTAIYKRLTLAVLKNSIQDTLKITIMMFMILTGAVGFSQILNYTGISSGVLST